MTAMQYVLTCDSDHWDVQANQCTQAVWMAQPTLVPLLTPEEGTEYGVGVLVVWAIAFGIRSMRRAL